MKQKAYKPYVILSKKKKKSLLPALWDKLGWVGNISMVLSFLSAMSKLKSWQQFRDVLSDLGKEFMGILDFFGRIFHFILTPWKAFTDYFFNFMPVHIPEKWHDPVIVGLFVFWLPLVKIVIFIQDLYRQFFTEKLERLMSIVTVSVSPEEYEMQLQKIKAFFQEAPAFRLILKGPAWQYLAALENNLPEDEVEMYREVLISYLNQSEIRDLYTSRDAKKNLRAARVRAVIALILLSVIVIDTIYSGGVQSGLSIVWFSFLTFIMIAAGSLILVIVVMFLYMILAKVILIAARWLGGEKAVNKIRALYLNTFSINMLRARMPQSWEFANRRFKEEDFRDF